MRPTFRHLGIVISLKVFHNVVSNIDQGAPVDLGAMPKDSGILARKFPDY